MRWVGEKWGIGGLTIRLAALSIFEGRGMKRINWQMSNTIFFIVFRDIISLLFNQKKGKDYVKKRIK